MPGSSETWFLSSWLAIRVHVSQGCTGEDADGTTCSLVVVFFFFFKILSIYF